MDKIKLTGIIADVTDEKITIMCSDDDNNTYSLNVPLMGYDETARKYKDDAEVLERAVNNLESIGLEIDTVALDITDHEFEAYADVETGRASFNPIQKYIRFNRIQTADAKALKQLYGQIIETLPVTDFLGKRFNFGIKHTVKDVEQNYKISSIRVPSESDDEQDRYISLRYESREAETFTKALETNTSLTEAQRKDVKSRIDDFNLVSREAKIRELNEIGFNVEKLIETGLPVKVQVEVFTVPNSDINYLVAEIIEMPDFDAIDVDAEKEAPKEKKSKK